MAKKKIKSLADIQRGAETPLERLEGTPIDDTFEEVLVARAEARFQGAVEALRRWYFDKSAQDGDCAIITKTGVLALNLELVFESVPRVKHFT